ncbi:MAG TPA: hypothetical protein VK139_08250 [Microbacteriaceae bacterium]|nr:hypothetical protein [Microbacteriaceae bacterium]
MRKSVLAASAAATVFAISGAAAASLSVTGYLPQTGTVSAACDVDGINVGDWTDSGGVLDSVVLSNISDNCLNSEIVVSVTNGTTTLLSTSTPVSNGTADVNQTTVSFSAASFGKGALTSYTVSIESAP